MNSICGFKGGLFQFFSRIHSPDVSAVVLTFNLAKSSPLTQRELLALDYFPAGVPPFAYFQMTLDEIRSISKAKRSATSSRLHELCFIGLMSYFEAFCKDHFASILNLEPTLLRNLKQANQNVDLDATKVLLYCDDLAHRLGFLIAEKYDFGSAQKINALFGSVLRVTPFGKEDAKKYGVLLNDRNLLVHHGGTFTLSYLEQMGIPNANMTRDAFFQSRTVRKADVFAAVDFLEEIAKKLAASSHKALCSYLSQNEIPCSSERKKALQYMLWS